MGGLFESVRTAGSGWYMQMALDSSLDSLMSKYHRDVWEQYRIFALEFDESGGLVGRWSLIWTVISEMPRFIWSQTGI